MNQVDIFWDCQKKVISLDWQSPTIAQGTMSQMVKLCPFPGKFSNLLCCHFPLWQRHCYCCIQSVELSPFVLKKQHFIIRIIQIWSFKFELQIRNYFAYEKGAGRQKLVDFATLSIAQHAQVQFSWRTSSNLIKGKIYIFHLHAFRGSWTVDNTNLFWFLPSCSLIRKGSN